MEARTAFKLRHVPLYLARELVRNKYNADFLLSQIVQRPDELTEFLAIYWKDDPADKHSPIAASVKRGLARAFQKFSAYQLAKYNRDEAIKLKDVLFLVHAKPKDDAQAALWKQLIDDTLPPALTWENRLSSGEDKLAVWTDLIEKNELGALALLRNLRNMKDVNVPDALVAGALARMKTERVLPFRFITAARYAPTLEPALETAMLRSLGDIPKLKGKTALLVDGSGSMFGTKVSAKSELDRFDAAAALAILVREVAEDINIYVFGTATRVIAPRHGFALRDELHKHADQAKDGYDRIIIITDEQSHQTITPPLKGATGYVVNVGVYKNGIGYGAWTHIDGWSESVLSYIETAETLAVASTTD